MSDNTNFKNTGSPNLKSVNDDSSQELDWMEIEDEAFDEADFEEDFQNPEKGHESETVRTQSKPQKPVSKKKSFSTITLVGLLLAGGGGYIYYAGILTPPVTTDEVLPVVSLTPTDTEPSKPVLLDNDFLALRNAPLPTQPTEALLNTDNATESKAAALTDGGSPPQQQDGVLTPLPDLLSSSQVELPPLEGEEIITKPPSQEQNILPTAIDALPPQALPTPELPAVSQDIAIEKNDLSLVPANDSNAPPLELPIDLSENNLMAQTEKLPDSKPKPSEIVAPEPLKTIPEAAPVIEKENAPIKSTTLASPALEKTEDTKIKPLTPSILERNAPKDTAREQVNIAKDSKTVTKQESLATNLQLKPVPVIASTPVAVPDKVKKDVVQAQKKSKIERKEARKISWKLRSAQPGTAVIYDPTTGNMQSIETGDRVSGIGRVKSISQVNGKWLVSGTSGSISQ